MSYEIVLVFNDDVLGDVLVTVFYSKYLEELVNKYKQLALYLGIQNQQVWKSRFEYRTETDHH